MQNVQLLDSRDLIEIGPSKEPEATVKSLPIPNLSNRPESLRFQLEPGVPYIPPRKPVPLPSQTPPNRGILPVLAVKRKAVNNVEYGRERTEVHETSSALLQPSQQLNNTVRDSGLRFSREHMKPTIAVDRNARDTPMSREALKSEIQETVAEDKFVEPEPMETKRAPSRLLKDNVVFSNHLMAKTATPDSRPESYFSLHSTVSGPLPLYYHDSLPSSRLEDYNVLHPKSPGGSLSQRSLIINRRSKGRGSGRTLRTISRSSTRTSSRSIYTTYSIYGASANCSRRSTMMSSVEFGQLSLPPSPPPLPTALSGWKPTEKRKKPRPGRILLPEEILERQAIDLNSRNRPSYLQKDELGREVHSKNLIDLITLGEDMKSPAVTVKSNKQYRKKTMTKDIVGMPKKDRTRRKIFTIYPTHSPRKSDYIRYSHSTTTTPTTPLSPTLNSLTVKSLKRKTREDRAKLMSPLSHPSHLQFQDIPKLNPELFQSLDVVLHTMPPERLTSVLRRGKRRKDIGSVRRVTARKVRASITRKSAVIPDSATLPPIDFSCWPPTPTTADFPNKPVSPAQAVRIDAPYSSSISRLSIFSTSSSQPGFRQSSVSVDFRQAIDEVLEYEESSTGSRTNSVIDILPRVPEDQQLNATSGSRRHRSFLNSKFSTIQSAFQPPVPLITARDSVLLGEASPAIVPPKVTTKSDKELPPLPHPHSATPLPSAATPLSAVTTSFDGSQGNPERVRQDNLRSMRTSAPPKFLNQIPAASSVIYSASNSLVSKSERYSEPPSANKQQMKVGSSSGNSVKPSPIFLRPIPLAIAPLSKQPPPRVPDRPHSSLGHSLRIPVPMTNEEYLLSHYAPDTLIPIFRPMDDKDDVVTLLPRSKSANGFRERDREESSGRARKGLEEVFRISRSITTFMKGGVGWQRRNEKGSSQDEVEMAIDEGQRSIGVGMGGWKRLLGVR